MATIQKRNNTYKITVSCGYDLTGKQIRRTMTWEPLPGMTPKQAEKEANKQAVLFEEKCRSGQVLDGNIKFANFVDRYFEEYAVKNLREKTLFDYKAMLPIINQAIGHIRLNRLQPHHLNAFYNNLSESGIRRKYNCKPLLDFKQVLKNNKLTQKQLSERANVGIRTLTCLVKGENVSAQTAERVCKVLNLNINKAFQPIGKDIPLSPVTIRHYHRFISSVLGIAVKWQVIMFNPCERVTLPKTHHIQPKYLDEEQATTLLSLIEQEDMQHKTMVKLFMYIGVRRGELCGLEWKDIDFNKNVINIRRSSLYIPKKGVIADTTKNETSQRCVKAPLCAMQMLKEYRAWQAEQRLLMGDRWNNTDRLFTTYDGMPIHPDTITGWFHDFIKRNGLPDISIHSLRHTNATLLINSGVPITTIAARLGHANPTTTTKIYTHAIRSADEAAADVLDTLLNVSTNELNKKIV